VEKKTRMKRQWLITLLLLVAALNIYLLVFIGKQDQQAGDALSSLDPEEITEIRVQRAQGQLVFQRQGEEWMMRSPLTGKANRERITELQALAVIQPLARYSLSEVDTARYGVDTPSITVSLNQVRIAFGNLNEANGRRYVQVGDGLVMIANNIYPILELPAERFLASNPE
jgi:hypothetical protein